MLLLTILQLLIDRLFFNFCDYNSIIICSYYYNYIYDVIRFWPPFCCSYDTTCNCWFNYKYDVIWILYYYYNSNTCSSWPCWSSWIICSVSCICSPIYVATNAYSWKLTSHIINYYCLKVCLATSLSRLSFPPLRFPNSFTTLVLDGPASSKVFGFGDRIKGSYSNNDIIFSI